MLLPAVVGVLRSTVLLRFCGANSQHVWCLTCKNSTHFSCCLAIVFCIFDIVVRVSSVFGLPLLCFRHSFGGSAKSSPAILEPEYKKVNTKTEEYQNQWEPAMLIIKKRIQRRRNQKCVLRDSNSYHEHVPVLGSSYSTLELRTLFGSIEFYK